MGKDDIANNIGLLEVKQQKVKIMKNIVLLQGEKIKLQRIWTHWRLKSEKPKLWRMLAHYSKGRMMKRKFKLYHNSPWNTKQQKDEITK